MAQAQHYHSYLFSAMHIVAPMHLNLPALFTVAIGVVEVRHTMPAFQQQVNNLEMTLPCSQHQRCHIVSKVSATNRQNENQYISLPQNNIRAVEKFSVCSIDVI